MKTDIEIARQTRLSDIAVVAAKLDLGEDDIERYGKYKAKLAPRAAKSGNLILVTAVNPTPMGEGKTTTSIGLADGLSKLGKKTCLALREPSLGPVFGVKGGATGGGMAQIAPMDEINLHFTGDLHAVSSANNLIAAVLDNHIFQGNALGIDPARVTWKRCMDMNDRALRKTVCGLGGISGGVPREDGFNITAASEIMAVLCLASDISDLKQRIGNIVVGYTYGGAPVTCAMLGVGDAAAILLKDAVRPNLVQTLEGTPAIVHGGPFANIAHGCNSVIATRTALGLADYVVTEAGFGADLGAEKFFDIKCRVAGISPKATVLVATVRALKYNGGAVKENVGKEDLGALKRGLCNLEAHVDNLVDVFGQNVVVAINRFVGDSDAELKTVVDACAARGVDAAICECWAKGGDGSIKLAEAVLRAIYKPSQLKFAYDTDASIADKICAVARKVYGAEEVEFSPAALLSMTRITDMGKDKLPVCIAKTQYSFSDDPTKLGRPTAFKLHVGEVELRGGAGFIVAQCGSIMLMPGLGKRPAALGMTLDSETGEISGLF